MSKTPYLSLKLNSSIASQNKLINIDQIKSVSVHHVKSTNKKLCFRPKSSTNSVHSWANTQWPPATEMTSENTFNTFSAASETQMIDRPGRLEKCGWWWGKGLSISMKNKQFTFAGVRSFVPRRGSRWLTLAEAGVPFSEWRKVSSKGRGGSPHITPGDVVKVTFLLGRQHWVWKSFNFGVVLLGKWYFYHGFLKEVLLYSLQILLAHFYVKIADFMLFIKII